LYKIFKKMAAHTQASLIARVHLTDGSARYIAQDQVIYLKSILGGDGAELTYVRDKDTIDAIQITDSASSLASTWDRLQRLTRTEIGDVYFHSDKIVVVGNRSGKTKLVYDDQTADSPKVYYSSNDPSDVASGAGINLIQVTKPATMDIPTSLQSWWINNHYIGGLSAGTLETLTILTVSPVDGTTGSGYAVNDTIDLDLSGFNGEPVIKVTAVDGSGGVTAAVVIDGGVLNGAPTNPVYMDATSGGGSGGRFNVTVGNGITNGTNIFMSKAKTGWSDNVVLEGATTIITRIANAQA
jgi:hypothetical protein